MNNKNDYQLRMGNAMRNFERAHIFALASELIEYRKTVERLLDNGRPILDLAIGPRFQKIYDKRRELWHKIATINHCIDIIYKHTL